jgi:hypothetical protein
MPTFPLGKPLAVYLAGYEFSSSNREYQTDLKVEAKDNTCFGSTFHKTNQPGLQEADISLKGYYNHTNAADVTGYANQLKAAVRVDTVGLAVMPTGIVPINGDLADLFIITAVDRASTVEVGEIITLDASFKTTTGLHVGNALTSHGAASFPTMAYDQGSAPAAGNIQYLVVLQVTAYTSGFAAITVQTSPDNLGWNTRGTFPAISAIGGYALALNTTLERYVRINGTGSGTIIAAFARIN